MSLHIIHLNGTLSNAILKYASLFNGSNFPINNGSLPILEITVSCDCGSSHYSKTKTALWIGLGIIIIILIAIPILYDCFSRSASKAVGEARKQRLPSGIVSTNSSTNQESSGECQSSRGTSSRMQDSVLKTRAQDPLVLDIKKPHVIDVFTLPRPTTNSIMSCSKNLAGLNSTSTIAGSSSSSSTEELAYHRIIFKGSPANIDSLEQALKHLGVDSHKIQKLPAKRPDNKVLYLRPYRPAALKTYSSACSTTSIGQTTTISKPTETTPKDSKTLDDRESKKMVRSELKQTTTDNKISKPLPESTTIPAPDPPKTFTRPTRNAASTSHSTSYPASKQVIEELEADIVELEKQACAACTKCGATPSYATSPSHSSVSDFGDTPLLDALEADILDLEKQALADCEYCGAV